LIRRLAGLGLSAACLVAPSVASAGTITVTQLNDGYNDNGLCTLREAISAAQGSGEFNTLDCDAGNDDNADTIVIPAGNTIQLDREGIDDTNVLGDLDVLGSATDNQLTIRSSGPGLAGIDASVLGDINPANGDRVLQTVGINAAQSLADFRLEKLEIKGGTPPPATGLRGAGLRFSGFTTATLTNVHVHDNSAGIVEAAGGLHSLATSLTINDSRFNNNSAGFAGGVWIESGTASINRTTLDNNHATAGSTGGLAVGSNAPVVTVRNTTIANNDAVGSGGGLTVFGSSPFSATLNVSNATIAGNTADLGEPGGTDNGGGIEQFGDAAPLNIRNSIVADNVDASGGAIDCTGAINSQGYNLIESATGCTFTNNNDLVGVDPKLNSLQGAGSPWTYWRMTLLSGSPAFNGANPATPDGISPNCETTDQEGFPRPFDGLGVDRCDIGAVEMSASDSDGDKHFNGLDNCTNVANPDQANHDASLEIDPNFVGDLCDSDDDNDGRTDDPPTDACPLGALSWTSNSGTDFDSDGCRDSDEDADDDNDTVLDTIETGCPIGGGLPLDTDSDDDTVLDGPDDFPCNAAETTDTDADGVGNNADNCDAIANPGQQNNDADSEGDACDADDDNDGVSDANDGCPTQANATATGCPTLPPAVTETGQRAAALKKCKKKKTAKARKKCKRKAKRLPL
jgi:CSLREA domain-containing protein